MIANDPLRVLSSWNDSIHFCEWYGVSCSRRHRGKVSALLLPYQELSGSVSPHIGNLSFLKVLNLSNNMFVGEIPSEIGGLRRLQRLDLYNNSLEGEIPPNISGCSALTVFDVTRNKLVGGLPWQLGLLEKLEIFGASFNNLSGSIPPSFGNLSSLQMFTLHQNQMSGEVPDALDQLKSLQLLVLSFNNLYGEIPASIFNISSLIQIWFGANQFHGSLPWNLGTSLPNLEKFDVFNNNLIGRLPPSLSNASNLVILQLNVNNFTGSVPSMANSNKLVRCLITGNHLGSGKDGDLRFLSSLTNATSLEFLHIGENNFGGDLPKHIGNLSTNLTHLGFSDNKISGNIPSEIQYLVNLEVLVAFTNLLSGTIPYNIGNLNSLQHLYLDNNHLSGDIPSSIGNLTRLIEVSISSNHLQGQIPVSIGNCKELLMLHLARNNLSGVIPSQLMSLASLSRFLGLEHNKFSGSIPVEVGGLKNLGSLDLSYNLLSGSIPSSMGSCVTLEYLQLQGNLLQGIIPSTLSSLRGIQVLDLSSNNLSGQIPEFLEQMNISQRLNLSYNNFEGEVPDQGAFKNTSIISVIGNSKLCGGADGIQFPPCYFGAKHSNKTFSHKWKIVISTVSIVIFLTLMSSCLFFLWKRGRKPVTTSTNALQLLPLSYERLYKATNGFSSENLIGVGSFGSVYKGILNENGLNTNVAVKVFNLQRHGASKSFVAECEALKNIRHRNLVRIVTVCSGTDYQGNDFKALIYEFLTNGCLEEWLHRTSERVDEPTKSLTFLQRVDIALGIAYAVDYLHKHCETPIVHCDLKPSNVLLDEDMVAHVGDFGLARFLDEVVDPSSSSIFIKGTVGYAPPEYGMGNKVSLQGDVYSYGILLLEMFTGRRPTEETFREGLNLHNIVERALLEQRTMEVVDPILHNNNSEETRNNAENLLNSILEIGVTCSSNLPEERANISDVLSKLIAISLMSNETDRAALLHFKSMISVDSSKALSSWNDSTHFCQWYGVSCSERHSGRVTSLSLQSQGLSGSISPHIGNLSFLKVLLLYNNSFIQEIPSEIGRLHRLQTMELYNNSLTGEIPSNISGCSALTVCRLHNNNLMGSLPWEMGNLQKLEILWVYTNSLTGPVPSSFGNLSSLQVFSAVQNHLSGTVPDSLGRLKNLTALYLNVNDLSGEIPASIFNLSSLTDLWFGMNHNLHGELPWNLGILLPNLVNFDVAYNRFTGSVPPSLSNVTNLFQLQLQVNSFTGNMPSMARCNNLLRFMIYGNSLGSGKDPDLSLLSSLVNASSLEVLEIYENNFGGRLPQDFGNLSTNLLRLTINDNKISGNFPSGIQNFIKLEVLWAENNQMSGIIQSSLGNLQSLQRLNWFNNNISGRIPSFVGNLTKLIQLDISANNLQGEIPASIENLKSLQLLNISHNNLRGVIPPQVMGLTSLSLSLDLSHNRFTGSLPVEVENLRNLGSLDLSHNMLSGSIPGSLGSCVMLESLHLQGNFLEGFIPSSLSSIRGIRELDLSANNLSGQIPFFLENMNISKLLNLSYNNFDGEMFEEGVFKNASIVSVIGNSKLCGGIPEFKLPPCKKFRNKSLSRKWKIVISTVSSLLFLAFIGVSFFVFRVKRRGKQAVDSVDDPQLQQLSYQRLYKATDGFSAANQVGVGSFGSVYKGVLDENSLVTNIAVKVFNLQRRGASKSFMAECEALKNIRHKNLVKILTVCSSVDSKGNDFKALIYEFLANGSLEDWLHRPVGRIDEPPKSLNFLQRVNIVIDIASAMDYLHNNCGTPIVHCDIKPSNILLDEDIVAHVGDFGLARFISPIADPSLSSIGIKGTVGYAPPEYGMGNEVSIQGDVYSYGVLLLEMFTGRRPIDETFREGLSLHNIVKSALSKQQTMLTTHRNHASSSSEDTRSHLEDLLSSILEIGVTCSSDTPEDRVSMSEVLSRLTAIRKKLHPVERM
ncbi:Probable LRR receptor-like serine/threonine-protein kinase At3g47570 [Linum perenne]